MGEREREIQRERETERERERESNILLKLMPSTRIFCQVVVR